jgi:hypothetical protein
MNFVLIKVNRICSYAHFNVKKLEISGSKPKTQGYEYRPNDTCWAFISNSVHSRPFCFFFLCIGLREKITEVHQEKATQSHSLSVTATTTVSIEIIVVRRLLAIRGTKFNKQNNLRMIGRTSISIYDPKFNRDLFPCTFGTLLFPGLHKSLILLPHTGTKSLRINLRDSKLLMNSFAWTISSIFETDFVKADFINIIFHYHKR